MRLINRDELLKEKVEDISLEEAKKLSSYADELLKIYDAMGGFSPRYLFDAYQLLISMLQDDSCTTFLSFTANLVATGMRGIIASMIKLGYFDVLITTGGTIDHDIARTFKNYYRGYFEMDDVLLEELEIHRLGNVLVPMENYGPIIESFTHKILERLVEEGKNVVTPSELLKIVGENLGDEGSILYNAVKKSVPIFAPGIVDSAFGTAIFTFNESLRSRGKKGIILDLLGDMRKIADIVFSSKKLGALMLGGGISKHHTIWWAQFKDGLDYAVYITTAVEWDGSLSGARTREAISWGKIKRSARHVTVPADVTLVMPILFFALAGVVQRRK